MLLQQAIKLVQEAGKEALKIYSRDFSIQEKVDKSPVTEADLVSEKMILSGLEKFGFGIISEETVQDNVYVAQDKVWVLDPLDGTSDFIQKTGEFTIMLALLQSKEPVLGIVYQPTLDKLYFAQKGKGAYLSERGGQPERLNVSNNGDFKNSRVILSRNHCTQAQLDFVKQAGFGSVKQAGSAGLKIGLIAQGKAEAYFTESGKTHQWDTAAGEIILKEAGGIITGLRGNPLLYCQEPTNHTYGILACNKALYPQILEALQAYFWRS